MPTPTRRDVHVDRPLSNVAIAYRNLEYIAGEIFPSVPVEKETDKYFIFDRASWFRVAQKAQRAPGTRAQRIDYTVSTGSYVAKQYALAKGVPDEDRDNADDPLRPEVTATEFVTDQLYLLREDRVATLVTGSANWASAGSPATQWDNDSSNVLGDVDTMRDTVIPLIGRAPNTMAMGWEVWSAIKKHPDLLDRIKFTQRGVLTMDLVASIFEVERLFVGRAIKDSATLEGQSASMGFVWGKTVWFGYVAPNPSIDVPSAGYVFDWIPFETSRFREDQERQDVFEVRHATTEHVTGSDAAYCMVSVVS